MEPLKISIPTITKANKDYCHHCDDQSAETCKHFLTQDFFTATILVVAYLIETFVQIILIVNCYWSLSVSGTSNWLWILFTAWLVTSLLVTLISITWTLRGMDFSDRICGQFLCYLMHLLLLGFLWRYLKITLAYEKPDVDEFFKLRSLQIYIQAFPLLVIHFAFLFTQSHENTIVWMIVGELCCSIISLSVQPLLKSRSDLLKESHSHKHKKTLLTAEINATIKSFFLISRLIVVGLLVSTPKYWSMLVIGAHVLVNFAWTFSTTVMFSDGERTKTKTDLEASSVQKSECVFRKNEDLSWKRCMKNSLVSSYTLFWDVTAGGVSGIGMNWWCISGFPVLLVLVENIAVSIIHLRQSQTTLLFVVVSGTCLCCGLLLLIAMATWNKWAIHSHSHDHDSVSKGLPVIDVPLNNDFASQRSTNLGKFFANTLIEKFGSYQLNNYLQQFQGSVQSKAEDINAQVNEVIANTNDYERINENLTMTTAVKIHERGSHNPKNETDLRPSRCATNVLVLPRLDSSHFKPETEPELGCTFPHENTLTSTSSRNTNTVSNLLELKSKEQRETPYQINPQTPLVIRKASKVVLNVPKHELSSGSPPRCPCQPRAAQNDNNIYEKLIEDAYGILICEGESGHKSERFIKQDSAHSTLPFNKKLRVLCAKCLQNHDPLLSDCRLDVDAHTNQTQNQNHLLLNHTLFNKGVKNQVLFYAPKPFDSPNVCSETTDYPTDTEFTCNIHDHEDEMSISTHLSAVNNSVTYANLPPIPAQCQSSGYFNHIFTSASALFPSAEVRKEFTGIEYVKAWLLMNDDVTLQQFHGESNKCHTNSLRKDQNRNLKNKVQSNKSKQILKPRPNSSLAKSCYYSQPIVCGVHLKPSPKHKQHPTVFIKPEIDNILFNILNKVHNAPTAHKNFKHLLHNDLLETIV